MRRPTAISQVLLLLAFYVLPVFVSSSAILPSCCRRTGAHHCTMQEHSSRGQTAFSSAVHCPYRFPAIALTHATRLFLSPASVATALPGFRERLVREDSHDALQQVAAGCDNRGPPVLTL